MVIVQITDNVKNMNNRHNNQGALYEISNVNNVDIYNNKHQK